MGPTAQLETRLKSALRKATRIWDADPRLINLMGRLRHEDPRIVADAFAVEVAGRMEEGAAALALDDLAARLAGLEALLDVRIEAREGAALGHAHTVLDAQQAAEIRAKAARALNVLLRDERIGELLRNAFAAMPLRGPQVAALAAAVAHAESNQETGVVALLRWIHERQPRIVQVCAAFDLVPAKLFGDRTVDRECWRQALSEEGAFRALAFPRSESTSMAREAAVVLTSRGVATDPRRTAIVKAWTDPLVAEEERNGGPAGDPFGDDLYGFFADEVNAYNRSWDEDPEPILPSGARANLYAIGGWFSSALTEYDAVLAANPSDAESRVGRAGILVRCGRLDEALPEYAAVLDVAGDHRGALLGRANVLRLQQRLDEALSTFERLLTADPDDQRAAEGRARSLADSGRLEEALSAFTDAQAGRRYGDRSGLGRARVLAALGRFDEALAALASAVSSSANRLWARGMIFLRAGDAVGAEAIFAAEVKRPFDHDAARFRMGLALARLRQRKLVDLPALLESAAYEPFEPLARVVTTHAHLLAGAPDLAAAAFACIPKTEMPALLDIRAELGRRLAAEPPRYDDDKLMELEAEVLEQTG